ncbi:PA2169 family four-helix-bundle protein [Gramella sp. MT6]|uniref:ferritin-like domain-containing protein n=1 Tax=Gramella sp. MT6 TaxID=2705471 RepID=UPI001C5D474C|nr:PA2169 family four-helix-bundle protein [Gramella sp. MT6]QYA26481.1 PA2169 family four-helix-bundle protein [Gramella sp. MT6]
MKTTRESAREASHKNLVQVLTDLLEKNYDAEKGYRKALEHTTNPDLKKFLKDQAVQRNHFATEIDKYIHQLNEHPKEKSSGTTLGSLHRFWIDFKSSVTRKNDESILEECIRGEKASLKEYEEKLKKNILNPTVKEMLEEHRDKIQKTLKQIKILEDLVD